MKINFIKIFDNKEINTSLFSIKKNFYAYFAICMECALVGAFICMVSGFIGGFLIETGYISNVFLLFFSHENFWQTIFYISAFSAFIGAFLGALTGALSYYFNKNFWM